MCNTEGVVYKHDIYGIICHYSVICFWSAGESIYLSKIKIYKHPGENEITDFWRPVLSGVSKYGMYDLINYIDVGVGGKYPPQFTYHQD